MKLINIIVIIYMASSILASCNSRSNFKNHINNLEEDNFNIKLYNDHLLQKKNLIHYNLQRDQVIGVISEDFIHKIIQNDTVIYLNYTYKPSAKNKEDGYIDIHFSKCYPENKKFHTVELYNNDTLCHYTTLSSIDNSRFFIDYQFVSGKYFFMYHNNQGHFSEGQILYFILNSDSLISVRGNDLSILPTIDTLRFLEFVNSGEYRKIVDEKPYLK